MYSRRKVTAGVVIILISGFVTASFLSLNRKVFSDPTLPRSDTGYEFFVTPGPKVTGIPPTIPSSVLVDKSDSGLVVRLPASIPPNNENIPFTLHRAEGTNAIQLPDGRMTLAFVAAGYSTPRTNFGHEIQLPAKFYTLDHQPVSTNVLPRNVLERGLGFRGHFPSAKFVFLHPGMEERFKFIGFDVFDARTKTKLTTGYTSSSLPDHTWFDTEIGIWHQAPLEIVATVATGPYEILNLAPEENAQVRYSGGILKLIDIRPGKFQVSSVHDGRTNSYIMEAAEAAAREKELTTFAFLSWVPGDSSLVQLTFFGRDKKQLAQYSSSTSQHLINVTLRGRPEDVQEIRVQILPHKHRLIFPLPELPELPEENRNVQNLFDVQVPYVRFINEWEMRQKLGQLLQMQMTLFIQNSTAAVFPRVYTNTTLREIFKDIEKSAADANQQLIVDSVRNEIKVNRHPLIVLMEDIRRRLGR